MASSTGAAETTTSRSVSTTSRSVQKTASEGNGTLGAPLSKSAAGGCLSSGTAVSATCSPRERAPSLCDRPASGLHDSSGNAGARLSDVGALRGGVVLTAAGGSLGETSARSLPLGASAVPPLSGSGLTAAGVASPDFRVGAMRREGLPPSSGVVSLSSSGAVSGLPNTTSGLPPTGAGSSIGRVLPTEVRHSGLSLPGGSTPQALLEKPEVVRAFASMLAWAKSTGDMSALEAYQARCVEAMDAGDVVAAGSSPACVVGGGNSQIVGAHAAAPLVVRQAATPAGVASTSATFSAPMSSPRVSSAAPSSVGASVVSSSAGTSSAPPRGPTTSAAIVSSGGASTQVSTRAQGLGAQAPARSYASTIASSLSSPAEVSFRPEVVTVPISAGWGRDKEKALLSVAAPGNLALAIKWHCLCELTRRFEMCFVSSSEARAAAMRLQAADGGRAYPGATYLGDPTVDVTLINCHPAIPESSLRSLLAQYGSVGQFLSAKSPFCPNAITAMKRVKMELRSHIPPTVSIPGFMDIKVRYYTQPQCCKECGVPGHLPVDCPNRRCKGCNAVGHMIAACPKIKCYRCGLSGHFARSCTTVIVCGSCKEEGHRSGAYPKKKSAPRRAASELVWEAVDFEPEMCRIADAIERDLSSGVRAEDATVAPPSSAQSVGASEGASAPPMVPEVIPVDSDSEDAMSESGSTSTVVGGGEVMASESEPPSQSPSREMEQSEDDATDERPRPRGKRLLAAASTSRSTSQRERTRQKATKARKALERAAVAVAENLRLGAGGTA